MGYFDEFPRVGDIPPVYPAICKKCSECGSTVNHYFDKMPWDDSVDVLSCSVCGFQVVVDMVAYKKSLKEMVG